MRLDSPMSFSWKTLPQPIIALSPMADMTDAPFCTMVRRVNTLYQPVMFREMVSAEAISRENTKTLQMADFDDVERPLIQQIFGSEPETMARAAAIIEERFHPDGIDINMGCPVYKLTCGFNGAALMKEPERAQAIIRAIKRVISVPLSVKLRLGWADPKEVLEFAPRVEEAGADLITIHGRTKAQAYTGSADWQTISLAKKRVSIPVLCNGDIINDATALKALQESACDGIMIARGALGNPWIFSQIYQAVRHPEFNSGSQEIPGQARNDMVERFTPPSLPERFRVLLEHTTLMLDRYGPQGIVLMRKHFPWYLKGLVDIKDTRSALVRVTSIEELRSHLEQYQMRWA